MIAAQPPFSSLRNSALFQLPPRWRKWSAKTASLCALSTSAVIVSGSPATASPTGRWLIKTVSAASKRAIMVSSPVEAVGDADAEAAVVDGAELVAEPQREIDVVAEALSDRIDEAHAVVGHHRLVGDDHRAGHRPAAHPVPGQGDLVLVADSVGESGSEHEVGAVLRADPQPAFDAGAEALTVDAGEQFGGETDQLAGVELELG